MEPHENHKGGVIIFNSEEDCGAEDLWTHSLVARKGEPLKSVNFIFKKNCWMCGVIDHTVQKHHAIPKAMKPKWNMTIPLCAKCHEKWHFHHKELVEYDYRKILLGYDEMKLKLQELKEGKNQ